MFKHILIPTDGSKLALKGARSGIKLAKKLGVKVTGLYVTLPYLSPAYSEASMYYVMGVSAQKAKKLVERQARTALAVIETEARLAGVRCETRVVPASLPWEAILRTARKSKCDLIAMASHGRSALGGLILGSQTTHVLSKSKIPVLVVR